MYNRSQWSTKEESEKLAGHWEVKKACWLEVVSLEVTAVRIRRVTSYRLGELWEESMQILEDAAVKLRAPNAVKKQNGEYSIR